MTNKDLRDYTERGVREGAKLDVDNVELLDLSVILKAINGRKPDAIAEWLDKHADELHRTTAIIDTDKVEDIKKLEESKPELILNKRGMSYIRDLDELLSACNDALDEGGYLWCHSRTSALKREALQIACPGIKGKLWSVYYYLWHRVCAKLYLTSWFYFWRTKGQNRSYPRVEILGRICRAGFNIVDERFSMGEFYVLGQKVKEPRRTKARNYGMLIKLGRVGYHGKQIKVYKFRTMYAYSEYLQPYMMEREGLQRGGKYKDDYRINVWGRMFRSNLFDEIPMFINVLRGEMKLVGVRPLSSAYFKLYTPEMQQMHISVKPGLMPPFYYGDKTPETLEDIQESEKKYIEAYQKHPFRTDWRYFWGIVGNILFKRKRSN